MIGVGCVIYHVLLRLIVLVAVLSFSSSPLRLQMRMMIVCPLPWFCFLGVISDYLRVEKQYLQQALLDSIVLLSKRRLQIYMTPIVGISLFELRGVYCGWLGVL